MAIAMPSKPLTSEDLWRIRWAKRALWLLGQRQQKRARQRSLSARILNGSNCLAHRAAMLIAPWEEKFYPGLYRAMEELLGVGRATVRSYTQNRCPLPAYHAERLANYLEAELAERREVIAALRAHAVSHAARVAAHKQNFHAGHNEWRRKERLRRKEALDRGEGYVAEEFNSGNPHKLVGEC